MRVQSALRGLAFHRLALGGQRLLSQLDCTAAARVLSHRYLLIRPMPNQWVWQQYSPFQAQVIRDLRHTSKGRSRGSWCQLQICPILGLTIASPCHWLTLFDCYFSVTFWRQSWMQERYHEVLHSLPCILQQQQDQNGSEISSFSRVTASFTRCQSIVSFSVHQLGLVGRNFPQLVQLRGRVDHRVL